MTDMKYADRTVLVTGAAGNIGSYFAAHAPKSYRLRLMVQGTEKPQVIAALRERGEVVQAELADVPRLRQLCDGVDTVVHLAGVPAPSATWEQLLPNNIVGTYNLFAAARFSNCRRVIYASSIHAVGGYPPDVQVKVYEPVNPGDLYGVSKCFGEALARYMADQEGLSSICVRIGAFKHRDELADPKTVQYLNGMVSDRDLQQLLERAIETPNIQFAIVHGLSNNFFKRMDISNARSLLGYDPQDDLTEINPTLSPLHLRDTVVSNSQHDPGSKSGLRQTERDTG